MKNIAPTQFITDSKGNKLAVVISFVDYQTMVEDFHDLRVVEHRKKEPTMSYGALKAKFKK